MEPKQVVILPSPILLVLLIFFVFTLYTFDFFLKEHLLTPTGSGHGSVYACNPST